MNLILQDNGYMHAWRNQAFAKRILFNQTLDQVGANPEVVEKSVSLNRRAEAEDPFALIALAVEVFEVMFFFSQNRLSKAAIGFDRVGS